MERPCRGHQQDGNVAGNQSIHTAIFVVLVWRLVLPVQYTKEGVFILLHTWFFVMIVVVCDVACVCAPMVLCQNFAFRFVSRVSFENCDEAVVKA
jgi:hypothetical protein